MTSKGSDQPACMCRLVLAFAGHTYYILLEISCHSSFYVSRCWLHLYIGQIKHTPSLIRAFASLLNILWVLSYWLNISFEVSKLKKWGCTGSSTLVKMPHCWKLYVTAHFILNIDSSHERKILDLEQIASLEISWSGSTLFLKESRSIYFEKKWTQFTY